VMGDGTERQQTETAAAQCADSCDGAENYFACLEACSALH